VSGKSELRRALRTARREHVRALPGSVSALIFNRPPRPLVDAIDESAVIGLYAATRYEAPANGYARFFKEAGHTIALPHLVAASGPMVFREYRDPFAHTDLEKGPMSIAQPPRTARLLTPRVLIVPLVGFTARGDRLGQGGGHYDRWLAEHPGTMAVGLAWDVQLIGEGSELTVEAHDARLDAIITPTRIYGDL
jgi:5-formyltetrahydrofolate cyclo-ligase